MSILFVDGQALSATELNAAFAQKVNVDADGSDITSLAGVGPTPRTLQNRFSDTVNVLDFLGSEPNGATDNTAQVQSAINAAAGNARLYFPPTTFPFRVTGLNLVSNSHLVIDGTIFLSSGSILSVFKASSVNNIVIEGSGVINGNLAGSTARCGIEAIGVSGLVVSGLTIQNCYQAPINGSNVSNVLIDRCNLINSGKAVQFTSGSSHAWIRNTTITSITDHGCMFYGGVTSSGILDCSIQSCNINGIYIYHDTANSVACSNIITKGNVITANGSAGINVDKGTGAVGNHSNILISHNLIYANNTSNIAGLGGIRNNTATNVQIVANQISRNGAGANVCYGISVAGSNTQIVGNQIVDESQGSVIGVGVFLANTANNVLIAENQIIDDQGTHTMKYGVSGVCGTGVRIYTNMITGMITSKYTNLTLAADTILLEMNDGGALTVTGTFATAGAYCDQSTVVVTPLTSFTNTIPNSCSTYIINPAGTLANGTVTMPATPAPGQTLNILTSQPITAFTLLPNSGHTVLAAPTSLNGNTGLSFIFNGTVWYCISASAGTASVGPLAVRVITASGAVTATLTDQVIIINKTTGAATAVALPASPATGMTLTIKDGKGDAGTNNITITPNTGLIDAGATAIISTNYAALNLCYSGSAWSIY
jgi:hypothetical protein